MVHPEVTRGYCEVNAVFSDSGARLKTFIGKFDSDGRYHMIGYEPLDDNPNSHPIPIERDQDLGFVVFPEGKSDLDELSKGDTFVVACSKRKRGDWPYEFLGLGGERKS